MIVENNAFVYFADGSFCRGMTNYPEKLEVKGELVFQTGIVGYLESITDPSYLNQILVLTYPSIGNYGVFDQDLVDEYSLSLYFESNKPQISALIVSECCSVPSHYLADKTKDLSTWLAKYNVPVIQNVDTRAITIKIREMGAIQTIIQTRTNYIEGIKLDFHHNYSDTNLVQKVSTKNIKSYKAIHNVKNDCEGSIINIAAIDFGIKNNQIRCLLKRGVNVTLYPYDYEYSKIVADGLFLSNGPGDPQDLNSQIKQLSKLMNQKKFPIFGICLGHQLLALASGAKTYKMKYGNRGHNIPCINKLTNRCYITSQNHGYAVDTLSLPKDFVSFFENANDGSNEGIIHKDLPYFSVQFHPEARSGPIDCEFLFDIFVNAVIMHKQTKKMDSLIGYFDVLNKQDVIQKHLKEVGKVLILGSGGLSIGQAGEFDYSGSQAIKALKEEGIYTVLINPNIATTQTSKGLADKVYFLPITTDFVRQVILIEKPDAIYLTFGGQTALNVGIKMIEELKDLNVKVLGTDLDMIKKSEDRETFSQEMQKINEPCAPSFSSVNMEEAVNSAKIIGYPVIVRSAYALGGLGSGFANNEAELKLICSKAFSYTNQVLIEKSLKGWKEIEYEIVRDQYDNCITVCNMENFDPLGIHTGDSIVVCPSQTLSDYEYNMLRNSSIKIARRFNIVGECNAQFALDPNSNQYYVIEINARLSRSSALASKATGYPLAFVAAKLGLGKSLYEIPNKVTLKTCACFEPSLDYIVVKIPKWDLNKFSNVSTKINSEMKSVGEVMAIGRKFEETIMKAIRAIDPTLQGFEALDSKINIDDELRNPSDVRLLAIANAFESGYSVEKIVNLTKIDKWFISKLKNIYDFEKYISRFDLDSINACVLLQAKKLGFSDIKIGKILKINELRARNLRLKHNIVPFYKHIDTVAAEFPAHTNYLYLTYNATEHDIDFNDQGIIVLGSGVYKIGSSVEFDWCAVKTCRTLRQNKIKTLMINYNPETVSTDYDEVDRLCFENITFERVLDIYEAEKSSGIIVSMGGQISNNIALQLHRIGAKILGTAPEMIDIAENRYKFSRMLDNIEVDQPKWKELTNYEDAFEFCRNVGYPVLVRPSYVLSGAAMNVVFSEDDLTNFLKLAVKVSRDFPVVISKFIENAKEIEFDGVGHNGKLIAHVLTEHVENAGVHSGDATLVYPPQRLDEITITKAKLAAEKICQYLNVCGPFNIQFIAKDNKIKVIECNLRAARSFPFVSKVTEIDMIELCTKIMIGEKIDLKSTIPKVNYKIAVKVPQFSFSRLSGADPVLGVEMASTGEVACFSDNVYEAYIKALLATGFNIPKKNILLSIGSYREKFEFLPSVKKLIKLEYKIFATSGTANFYEENGIKVQYLDFNHESKQKYSIEQHLANNLIDLYINLPSNNRYRRPANYISKGYKTRRMAIDYSIPLITNIKCARLFVNALENIEYNKIKVSKIDCQSTYPSLIVPGSIGTITCLNINSRLDYNKLLEELNHSIEGSCFSQFVLCIYYNELIDIDTNHLNLLDQIVKCNIKICILYEAKYYKKFENLNPSFKNITLYPFIHNDRISNYNTTEFQNIFKNKDNRIIYTNAKGPNLNTLLLLSSIYTKRVHIMQVSTNSDVEILLVLKEKMPHLITFDVSVIKLYEKYLKEDILKSVKNPDFKSQTDIENIASITDCVSLGDISELRTISKNNNIKYLILNITMLHITLLSQKILKKEYFFNQLCQNIIKVFDCLKKETDSIEVELGVKSKRLNLENSIFNLEYIGVFKKLNIIQNFSDVTSDTKINYENKLDNIVDKDLKLKIIYDESEANKDIMKRTYPSFYNQHVLNSSKYSRYDLRNLFDLAQHIEILMENKKSFNILEGYILCNLFFEPSTRTSVSFQTAMIKLGGKVINVNDAISSVKKGESLSDTIKCLNQYSDLIVLRHPVKNSVQDAAKASSVPIINGGDGVGEHPSQAFLDIFTIREELGTVNGLEITIVGDLKNGRTVHSLVRLLSLYRIRINYVSPPQLKIPNDIYEELAFKKIPQNEYEDIYPVIKTTDVLYVTRIQKERFEDEEEYIKLKDQYIINDEILSKAKANMIVMHPLPRVNEIDTQCDLDTRAAYFRQMKYGLYIRMALILMVFKT